MDELSENAPCGIFEFSDDGKFTAVNSTMCRILEFKREELLNKSVENVFTIPTKIFFQTHLFPLLKLKGSANEIFITLKSKKDKVIPVLLNSSRSSKTLNSSGAFIVVENRKKFEEELIEAKKVAERALSENSELKLAKADLEEHKKSLDVQITKVIGQNNELKQINHAATHTLKESIRKILLFGSRIHATPEYVTSLNDLDRLAKSTMKLSESISGLQNFMWLGEMEIDFKQVDLNEIIEEEFIKLKSEDLNFNFECDKLPAIYADSGQMRLLFKSIFENAVRFRKNDLVEIKVSATIVKLNQYRHLKDKYYYREFLKIDIADHGVGFDPIYKNLIFELFKKLHSGEGSGVGLALSKKIAENHGGRINADSKIDKFTVIELLLPIYDLSMIEKMK